MSSLARRTLRATAAVAGIAVAGVGVAGPAVAGPELPNLPNTGGATPAAPAAPNAGSSPDIGGDLRAPEVDELPQLFTIGGTSVYTADGPLPELPTVEQMPSASDVVNVDEHEHVEDPDVEFRTAAAPQDPGSALQQLDTASMFGGLTDTALGATEGNDVGH